MTAILISLLLGTFVSRVPDHPSIDGLRFSIEPESRKGRIQSFRPKFVNRSGKALSVYMPQWGASLASSCSSISKKKSNPISQPSVGSHLFIQMKPGQVLYGIPVPVSRVIAGLERGSYRIVFHYDDRYPNSVGKSWHLRSQVGKLQSNSLDLKIDRYKRAILLRS